MTIEKFCTKRYYIKPISNRFYQLHYKLFLFGIFNLDKHKQWNILLPFTNYEFLNDIVEEYKIKKIYV